MRDRDQPHTPHEAPPFADWDIRPPPDERGAGTHVPPPVNHPIEPPNLSYAGMRLLAAPALNAPIRGGHNRKGGKRDREWGDARPVALERDPKGVDARPGWKDPSVCSIATQPFPVPYRTQIASRDKTG